MAGITVGRSKAIRAAKIMGDAVMLADMAALATYAQAYADLARLSLEIRAEGEVKTFGNGLVAANKMCALRDRAQRAMHIAGAKLGFSPADRSRASAVRETVGTEEDPFADFIK